MYQDAKETVDVGNGLIDEIYNSLTLISKPTVIFTARNQQKNVRMNIPDYLIVYEFRP